MSEWWSGAMTGFVWGIALFAILAICKRRSVSEDSTVSEPSAWAEHVIMTLIRDCVDHTPLPPPCATCVKGALDAAWRAGAEAMRRRSLGAFYGQTGKPLVSEYVAIPLPEPGEDR